MGHRYALAAILRKLLRDIAGRRVAVVGDVMLDVYLSGPIERISPEAPVPVFEVSRHEYKLGGAANVAACLATLGARVKLCGVVGNDEEATHLFDQAAACRIDTSTLLTDPERPTTCKTRVVARRQQVMRLDRESRRPLSAGMQHRMVGQLADVISWAEAIVLSDYSKGVLTETVCRAAIELAERRPVIVDPKKLPWTRFRGATLIKPNRTEAEQYVQQSLPDGSAVIDAGRRLRRELAAQHVLITCGADGMTLVEQSGAAYHWDACPRELVDVTGAGDVVAASLAIAMAAGWEARQAAWFANVTTRS